MRIAPRLLVAGAFAALFAGGACRAPRAGAVEVATVVLPADGDVGDLRVQELLRARGLSAALVSAAAPLPAHVHERHDETVYVLSGAGRMWVDGLEVELRPGLLVHVPRGAVHAVAPEGTAHALSIFTPPFDGADRVLVGAEPAAGR